MKEEDKRYTLVEYLGPQVRYYKKYSDYLNLLETIDKSNKKKDCRFYFGNASCEKLPNGKYRVTVYVYNKLTNKMTISELDNLTSNKNEETVIKNFRDLIRTNPILKPDINIMYFEEKNKKEKMPYDFDKRIKYIPVLYARDKRFLDRTYIFRCIHYKAANRDINFFKELANEFRFYHAIVEKIEVLRKYINLCEEGQNYYKALEDSACNLYDAFVVDRNSDKSVYLDDDGKGSNSRRRVRDFGFFVRDYMLPNYKRISPTKYNHTLSEWQIEALKAEMKAKKDALKAKEKKEVKVEQLKLI